MSIPGLSAYPDLEERYQAEMRRVAARRTRCRKCDRNKVIDRFRRLLQDRLERDRLGGRG